MIGRKPTKTEMKPSIAIRIKAARKAFGVSQAHLETVCKLGQGAISHFESGSRVPEVETLRKIKRVLGCSWGDLLGE
jgi:transcriptional regulator with XRE-family HTH domain